jgi:hypothetical protein
MNVVTLDLAAKFSAATVLNPAGDVTEQWDSFDISPIDFIEKTVGWVLKRDALFLVEDLPAHLPSSQIITTVRRLQGAFILQAAKVGVLDRMLFVDPATWQKHFPGVGGGWAPAVEGEKRRRWTPEERYATARLAAEVNGYTPPMLAAEYVLDRATDGQRVLKTKVKELEKQETDYVDAFLIGRWALDLGEDKIRSLRTVTEPTL